MILESPYRSQWPPEQAPYSTAMCGAACLSSVIKYRLNKDVSVNDLAHQIGMTGLISFSQLASAARKNGMAMTRKRAQTIEDVKDNIRERKPSIALINYGRVPATMKQDQIFRYGHFILIIGFDDNGIIYHDPNFRNSRRAEGAARRMPYHIFLHAWDTHPYQMAAPYSMLVPDKGKEQPQPAPPTPPTPPPSKFKLWSLKMDEAKLIAKALTKVADSIHRHTRLLEKVHGIQLTTYKEPGKPPVYPSPNLTGELSIKEFRKRGLLFQDVIET